MKRVKSILSPKSLAIKHDVDVNFVELFCRKTKADQSFARTGPPKEQANKMVSIRIEIALKWMVWS